MNSKFKYGDLVQLNRTVVRRMYGDFYVMLKDAIGTIEQAGYSPIIGDGSMEPQREIIVSFGAYNWDFDKEDLRLVDSDPLHPTPKEWDLWESYEKGYRLIGVSSGD